MFAILGEYNGQRTVIDKVEEKDLAEYIAKEYRLLYPDGEVTTEKEW